MCLQHVIKINQGIRSFVTMLMNLAALKEFVEQLLSSARQDSVLATWCILYKIWKKTALVFTELFWEISCLWTAVMFFKPRPSESLHPARQRPRFGTSINTRTRVAVNWLRAEILASDGRIQVALVPCSILKFTKAGLFSNSTCNLL
jgi:hypothetical protein